MFPKYPYSDANMISSANINELASTMASLKDFWLIKGVKEMFDRNFSQCKPQSALIKSKIAYKMGGKEYEYEWFDKTLDQALREAALDPRAHGMEALYDYDSYESTMEDFLPHDLALLVAVIAVNFLLTWFHTQSLGLSSASIFGILMTFPLAYCVYRLILQVQWFGILNLVALFVVLGIGADDTFVLSDAWKQSAAYFDSDDLQSRMEYTLRKSFRSILTTSVTSAAAFFANLISDIPPLRLFGILIGSMVVFDFLITITFLPAVLVCVYRCTPRNTWCFCIKRPAVKMSDITQARLASKNTNATTFEMVTLEATASQQTASSSEAPAPCENDVTLPSTTAATAPQNPDQSNTHPSSSSADVSLANKMADDSHVRWLGNGVVMWMRRKTCTVALYDWLKYD